MKTDTPTFSGPYKVKKRYKFAAFDEMRPPGQFTRKELENPPKSDLFKHPVCAAALGLSKVTTSQTNAPAVSPVEYRFQVTLQPHCMTLAKIVGAPVDNGPGNLISPALNRMGHDVFISNLQRAEMPKSNRQKRFLSDSGGREIMKSIGHLVQGSRAKKSKRGGFWRVSMITLTLPGAQAHKDKTLNKLLLNSVLVQLRRWGAKNYVWVRELQKNGSAHWHLVTDCYVDKLKLRKTWNNALAKLGYIERYRLRHNSMKFSDYWNEYQALPGYAGPGGWQKAQRAYSYGVQSGWCNPNTTDVSAVRNVDKVIKYCAKYMIKNNGAAAAAAAATAAAAAAADDAAAVVYWPVFERRTTGRKWGRSESVSAVVKLKAGAVSKFYKPMFDLFNKIIDSVPGDRGFYFENDRCRGWLFEPLSVPIVNELLAGKFAGWRPG